MYDVRRNFIKNADVIYSFLLSNDNRKNIYYITNYFTNQHLFLRIWHYVLEFLLFSASFLQVTVLQIPPEYQVLAVCSTYSSVPKIWKLEQCGGPSGNSREWNPSTERRILHFWSLCPAHLLPLYTLACLKFKIKNKLL